jgi:hypothetical protein
MPLKRGHSAKTIAANIRELSHSKTARGRQRSHRQNIAIAMRMAGKARRPRSARR